MIEQYSHIVKLLAYEMYYHSESFMKNCKISLYETFFWKTYIMSNYESRSNSQITKFHFIEVKAKITLISFCIMLTSRFY